MSLYLETARAIIDGILGRPTLAVSERSWKKAQAIVGRMLAGSNETYIQHNILRAHVEHIAEALDREAARRAE